MQQTRKLLKNIPFIKFETFLKIIKVSEHTWEKWNAAEVINAKPCPKELLEKIVSGAQIINDLIIEAIENPASTAKIQKYIDYKTLAPLIPYLDEYLAHLESIEKHAVARIESENYSCLLLTTYNEMLVKNLLESDDSRLFDSDEQKRPENTPESKTLPTSGPVGDYSTIDHHDSHKPQHWPITNLDPPPKLKRSFSDRIINFLSNNKENSKNK